LLKNKPHIVLITTWFPPQKGVAVNRMYAFAKYLENFNYKVSVITITTGNEKDKEQAGTTNIYRLKNNAFLRYLNEIPGESRTLHSIKVIWNYFINKLGVKKYNAWHSHVIATLEQINIEEKIDIVISSFSPEETHLAAYKFCIKYPSVKWIADMRDEMSKNPHINASAQNKLAEIENMIKQRNIGPVYLPLKPPNPQTPKPSNPGTLKPRNPQTPKPSNLLTPKPSNLLTTL